MPIPFHAGHKLAWLEQVAADRNTSDFQVRVAISVTRRTDRTGVAVVGQESIAGFIGASSRGVRNALRGLAELEHIDRQDEGVGGRGVVGKYSLLSKQACAADGKTDQSRNGITRNEQAGPDKTRNSENENAEPQRGKAGNCVPTESCSSIDSLEESSDGHQAVVSFEWEQVLQRALSRYGADVFLSWFSKINAVHIDNDVGIVVVTPAQQLMLIVPSESTLEVEAMISNRDAGFVSEGQSVDVKIDTFNFTRYGLLQGKVVSVSQDAIIKDKPQDPSRARGGGALADTSEPVGQELLYSTRVALDRTDMQIEGRMVNLAPGMAVTVEIKTGTRRLIEYLMSSLLRYRHESLRER